MKIERFEDLIAWQEARKLVNLIYNITQKDSFKDFGLANQVQKAAVSVMANISEGFGRYSLTSKLINGLIRNANIQIVTEPSANNGYIG